MPNQTLAHPNAPRAPKLLDRVRETMHTSRYSPRTETVYVHWIKRYIRFHCVRHPQEMGADEVKAFLSHLAIQTNVAASTQNQAFSARPFLYQDILKKRLPRVDDLFQRFARRISAALFFKPGGVCYRGDNCN
jgi:hypothetical protein